MKKVKCTCVEETYISFLGIQLPVVSGLDAVPRSECTRCNGTGVIPIEEKGFIHHSDKELIEDAVQDIFGGEDNA